MGEFCINYLMAYNMRDKINKLVLHDEKTDIKVGMLNSNWPEVTVPIQLKIAYDQDFENPKFSASRGYRMIIKDFIKDENEWLMYARKKTSQESNSQSEPKTPKMTTYKYFCSKYNSVLQAVHGMFKIICL